MFVSRRKLIEPLTHAEKVSLADVSPTGACWAVECLDSGILAELVNW